jgi:hypothetical protein
MASIFNGASAFNQNLAKWSTARAANMYAAHTPVAHGRRTA